jgi:phage tail sheath protein FI
LNALRDVDDVNMVCIPDAALHPERQTIQSAMINHCLGLGERFAILDPVQGAPPSGPNSVEEQRQRVQSTRGFAALYYPWLIVRDPRSRSPRARTMYVPPSGHIAGIYARTDAERGVHKAPANTEVRGVLGLEQILSDRQQGPLNLRGINVLRIFPGTSQATVWGARTTVDPTITDWLYVPVRRLMLYIEESIEEGIRWAVFEPNNLQLWKKLKRTISEFLTRVWRDGALFGETADKAFYVRIDEALNPDRVRALGRLYIEIGVRPSYPAEFIIVRIGLWDGGAEITES